jgi:hypothetical protein
VGRRYAERSGDLIGSRLWLLHRTKSDNTLPARARGYILEALQWLLDGGVVGGVDATCFFLPNATGAVTQRRLGATVTLYSTACSRWRSASSGFGNRSGLSKCPMWSKCRMLARLSPS